MKLGENNIKIELLDSFLGNLHTFEAVLKIRQILFLSIGSKYLTLSVLG